MKRNQLWIAGAILVGLAAGCSGNSSSPAKSAVPPPKAGDQKAAATKSGLEIPPPP